MRVRERRLVQMARAIASAPVRPCIVKEQYEWFESFGELPDEDPVAYAVVLQALNGGKETHWNDEDLHPSRRPTLAQRVRTELERSPPTVRKALFEEALFEHELMRGIARSQIAREVAYGGDVTNPAFGARHGLPIYGSVALHVGGFPRRYIKPPYEEQGQRLLVREDDIRGRMPQGDPRWIDATAKALVHFGKTGELPDDELQAETVLLDAELWQLLAHGTGKDVSHAMRLFDLVAHRGDGAEEALKELCRMAAAGVLERST